MMKFPRFLCGICFVLLINVSRVSSFKILSNKIIKGQCNSKPDDYLFDEIDEVPELQDYFPTSGIETFVSTIASRRILLPSEYELSFMTYPVLKDQYRRKKWPERELEASEDVEKYISWVDSSRTDADVETVLINFRKTILSKEKYRIVNPGKVAEQYCVLLKSCLEVEDSWGAAANALEYAGLVIRDHVIEREILEDRSTGNEVEVEVEVENCRPMLVVHSLWQQACMRLLDVDTTCTDINTIDTTNLSSFSSTSTSTSTSTFSSLPSLQKSQKTWDQKFFSQIEMSESGRVAIQDMMLCVLRVAVRCLLSRSNVDSVDIVVNELDAPELEFYPPLSSIKIILSLDKDLKMINEGECDKSDCHKIFNLMEKIIDQNKNENINENGNGTENNLLIETTKKDDDNNNNNTNDNDDHDDNVYNTDIVSTDTYVFFTICDSESTLEIQPKKGIFDGFQELEVQDPDSFM